MYCSYTTETSHKNVISCRVSLATLFPKVSTCMCACIPETQRKRRDENNTEYMILQNAHHVPSGQLLFSLEEI